MPANPCVSHGQCWAIHVLGSIAGAGNGAFGGTAALGNIVAAAEGTTLEAAANRSGLEITSCSFRKGVGGMLSTTAGSGAPADQYPAVSESDRLEQPLRSVVPMKNRRVWRDLARILSTIFNPFLTALALFVILALIGAKDTWDFWRLLFISTFFTSLGPMLYVFWLYATDRISDLDMSVRIEREMVFTAFVFFYSLGAAALWIAHAPRLMIAAMLGYLVSTLVVQYITRYWKISTHALGITAPLTALTLIYGRQPLPFMILIPMVCWARVYLRAHTVMQVVAGVALAVATTAFFFSLFHVGLLSAH